MTAAVYPTRRGIIRAGAAFAAAASVPRRWAVAQARPVKIGLLLPFSGAYARLGENITLAIEVLLAEKGGRLGGREVEIIKADDESRTDTAAQRAERLIRNDKVDVLIGSVQPAAQAGIHKVVSQTGTLTIVPGPGSDALTRELCARNVFRTSFSNWQPAYGMGRAAAEKGYKKAVWMMWDYEAGRESGAGFKQAFAEAGGEMLPDLALPFPQTSFEPLLAQVPSLGADVVAAYFAGGGAVLFVKAYAAAGIGVPLCGPGFLTEGTLQAQGTAAEGLETALHYGDGLDLPKNIGFRRAFRDKAERNADVYAVQGYDAGQLLAAALEEVGGNIEDEAALYKALRSARIESPRGTITMSPSQNVVQNIYLRKVEGGQNKVSGIAAEALADPGTGCKLE
jgi:branched-chain amino acid transport system substrate-binding protein